MDRGFSSQISKKSIVMIPRRIFSFYWDGFRSMVVGRTLWKIILIKLIIIYALLKLFFPNYLQNNFVSDEERANYVLEHLTETQKNGQERKE